MENCVKESKEISSQRKNDQTLCKCSWLLFAVAILLALVLLVRVELVVRDAKTLAQEMHQIRQSLKKLDAPQDRKKEDVDAIRGRRQVFHFVIIETYTYCRRRE